MLLACVCVCLRVRVYVLNRVFYTLCAHFGTDRTPQGLARKRKIRPTSWWYVAVSHAATSSRGEVQKVHLEFPVVAPRVTTGATNSTGTTTTKGFLERCMQCRSNALCFLSHRHLFACWGAINLEYRSLSPLRLAVVTSAREQITRTPLLYTCLMVII